MTEWRSKPGSLSLREARAGREPERGVPNPNGHLSPPAWPKPIRRGEGPSLSSLWAEREKNLASGSRNLRISPSIRLNLKAIWNEHPHG